jgi:DNA polymerase III alpha subunit
MDLKSRAVNAANLDLIVTYGQQRTRDNQSGQTDLFGGPSEPPPLELMDAEPWDRMYALQQEFNHMGLFLSGHPLDEYKAVLAVSALKYRNDEIYMSKEVFELVHGKPNKRKHYAKSR